MKNQELIDLLKRETNMTESDIKRHIKDGIMLYTNDETGKQDFIRDCVEGLGDPESALEEWELLEVVGNFKMDFIV